MTCLRPLLRISAMRCPCRHGIYLKGHSNNRDVAMIFHAHCLCPFHFNRTVLARNHLRTLAFPLERLDELYLNGIWCDTQSEKLWIDTFSHPYQVWTKDPSQGGVLKLQDIEMRCPVCGINVVLDLDKFVDVRANTNGSIQCSSCLAFFGPRQLIGMLSHDKMYGSESSSSETK